MQVKRLRLLCLPCAGASATMYLRWKRHLPAWIEIYPVELPGRGERLGEPLIDDFETLVVRLCEEREYVKAHSVYMQQRLLRAIFGDQ